MWRRPGPAMASIGSSPSAAPSMSSPAEPRRYREAFIASLARDDALRHATIRLG